MDQLTSIIALSARLKPSIIDATLREGMQAAGVDFSIRQSVEIAQALSQLPIDMIECGHPGISEAECKRVEAVVAAAGDLPVLAHARARMEDIDAVAASGAAWVGIFLGVDQRSLSAKLGGKSFNEALQIISETVTYANSLGLRVRYTVEAASFCPMDDLMAAYDAALASGAHRICFADTAGRMTPTDVSAKILDLKLNFPSIKLETHFHDDRGLAMANALAAMEAGADWISTSVNGLGERAGITDTAAFIANLVYEGRCHLPHPEKLQDIARRVAAYSRAAIDERHPATGRRVFTHVAQLHRLAMEHDPKTYQWIEPALLGRQHELIPYTPAKDFSDLVNVPPVISAAELRHHRHGPGMRHVMIDERFVEDCRQYCIVRTIPSLPDYGAGHVDEHMHICDSLFMFIGSAPDLTGLTVEVDLDGHKQELQSPISVFIPSGRRHSYRIISGSGYFINHVLSGSYEQSLLDEPKLPTAREVAA